MASDPIIQGHNALNGGAAKTRMISEMPLEPRAPASNKALSSYVKVAFGWDESQKILRVFQGCRHFLT